MKTSGFIRTIHPIDPTHCPVELRGGIEAIQSDFAGRFGGSGKALRVGFERDPALRGGGLSVNRFQGGVRIRYGRTIDAFRALGRLMGEGNSSAFPGFSESPRFETLGVMLDVSRNAVLRVETAQIFIRRLALMGINMVMLYAEDVYQVPGEPFFGYLRGGYSFGELRALDRYAQLFGIEVIPCIQTLGHLEQILKWPAYEACQDVPGVLLAGEKKTYTLLERMIRAASAPFRSKRIHIGMDEAHGLGTGRYRLQHGERPPFDVFCEHLRRVRQICRKFGLRPMIWSDMFFRLGSKGNDYYDKKAVIPASVARRIPRDVQLVYWDYYHLDASFYSEWIERHRRLGCEPVMAGGVWTWGRFWLQSPFTFATTDACMRACKAKKLKEVFATAWGDDGMECDLLSALPGIQYFAEHGYANTVDGARLRRNFHGSCNADFDAWCKASELDAVPRLVRGDRCVSNLSKWLLWEDPVLGLFEKQVPRDTLARHYAGLARALAAASRREGGSRHLDFPARLASVLALKSNLRAKIVKAYRKGDRRQLRAILRGTLPLLQKAIQDLRKTHREVWLELFKPFGWEVLDARYGGLLARVDTLSERLRQFAARRIDSIPELDASLKKPFPMAKGEVPHLNHRRCVSASCIV